MPVKDHINAFRSTKASFKPSKPAFDEVNITLMIEIQGNSRKGWHELYIKLIVSQKKPCCFKKHQSSKIQKFACNQPRRCWQKPQQQYSYHANKSWILKKRPRRHLYQMIFRYLKYNLSHSFIQSIEISLLLRFIPI